MEMNDDASSASENEEDKTKYSLSEANGTKSFSCKTWANLSPRVEL